MNVYAAEEAIAVHNNFWRVYREVIRMDGAVLYLEVMSAKESNAADVDAEAFGNINIDATKDARRVDGGSTTVQGDAREIDVHATEKAQRRQRTSYCPAADSRPAEDPHRKGAGLLHARLHLADSLLHLGDGFGFLLARIGLCDFSFLPCLLYTSDAADE